MLPSKPEQVKDVSDESFQSMDEANPFDQQEEENDSTAKD